MKTTDEILAELRRVREEGERAAKNWRKWDDEREALRRRAVDLEHELRLARLDPPEPSDVDAVLFHKRYVPASTVYVFAAARALGRWWITGALSPQFVTWRELVDFARRDNADPLDIVPLIPRTDPPC